MFSNSKKKRKRVLKKRTERRAKTMITAMKTLKKKPKDSWSNLQEEDSNALRKN